MGRVKSAERNILFGYIGQIATAFMAFILRTVFIRYLSRELLGVNSLYTDILSVLSMAELGIGTAMNFSLYGPVARGEREKVKSYMQMYRRVYTAVAMVIAGVGLILLPFLPVLVKDPGALTPDELRTYYLIFLFNTVTSYFVTYKYSLVNAEQKNYIQTNILTITKIVSSILQILVVVLTQNFLLFLLTDSAVQLIQKFLANHFLNRLYPYLTEKDVAPLSKEESGEIWKKSRALMLHRIGDIARLQTDSMIISAFINVATAGIVNTNALVVTTAANFVNIIFNNIVSGFGNLIATESKERQYEMFGVYRFLASWLYGYSACGFFVLLTPLITLLWGPELTLPAAALWLYLTDYYFKGERIVLTNFKTAAGIFEQDRYLALLQGIVNLILSIVLVQKIGLAGIYVGTVVSGLIANITKPFIIYHVCFDRKAWGYFADSAKYLAVTAAVTAVSLGAGTVLRPEEGFFRLILTAVLITVLFFSAFFLLFGRTKECRYLLQLVRAKLHRD